ncbi:MAG: LptF/LptG family permease, partial [Parachlamydia sp.]|nr:LptF/LptG family permease [Parachlamydia sp.]
HNKHILKLKGIFFNALGESRMGEKASDVIVALPNKNNKSIHVLLAKQVTATPSDFVGTGVTLLTSANRDEEASDLNGPEFLFSENIAEANTTAQNFSQLIYKKVWSLNNDHLRLPLLMIRLSETSEAPLNQDAIYRIYSEMLRRLSVALAAFTFTLMGIAFGISTSRTRSQKSICAVLFLSTLYLACFFAAKNYDHLLTLSATLYLVPQALIIGFSLWKLNRITRGIA